MNTRMDPAVPNQVTNSGADDVKRAEEIKRADDLKRKAEADLAAVAEAKAKLAAESAKQSEIKSNNMNGASDEVEAAKSERLWRVEPKSSESKEIIEAALLGALEPDDSSGDGQDESKADNKSEQQTTDKRSEKAVTAQRKPRKPQYDVIFLKEKDEIDAPQLLEGSLKDLLNDGSMRKRRSPSGDNY